MSINDGLEGSITFFYYNDLAKADEFYSEIMGFQTVIDVVFAKVFKISDGAHVGIVDGNIGSIKPTEDKPVMLSIIVDDADAWYKYLIEKGVDVEGPPKKPEYLEMKVFLFRDTEGYVLEILEWLNKPYNS